MGQAPAYAGVQTLSIYVVSEEKQEQSLVAKGEVTAFTRPTGVVWGKTGQKTWFRGMSFKFKKKPVELQARWGPVLSLNLVM